MSTKFWDSDAATVEVHRDPFTMKGWSKRSECKGVRMKSVEQFTDE